MISFFFSLCGKVVSACLLGRPESFVVEFCSFLWVCRSASLLVLPRELDTSLTPSSTLSCTHPWVWTQGDGTNFKTIEGLESIGQTVVLMTFQFPSHRRTFLKHWAPYLWFLKVTPGYEPWQLRMYNKISFVLWASDTRHSFDSVKALRFEFVLSPDSSDNVVFTFCCFWRGGIVDKYLGYLWRPFFGNLPLQNVLKSVDEQVMSR